MNKNIPMLFTFLDIYRVYAYWITMMKVLTFPQSSEGSVAAESGT